MTWRPSTASFGDVARRFGAANIKGTRHLLLEDVRAAVGAEGRGPDTVHSVFDAGCSLGYLLRHVETEVFRFADVLEGIDIDRRAIEEGTAYLAAQRSKVRLHAGDLTFLDRVMAGRAFDVIFCAGVLMYVRAETAAAAVATMLARCSGVVALSGPAHPRTDNRELAASEPRANDNSLIHNFDDMVRAAGGRTCPGAGRARASWTGTPFIS